MLGLLWGGVESALIWLLWNAQVTIWLNYPGQNVTTEYYYAYLVTLLSIASAFGYLSYYASDELSAKILVRSLFISQPLAFFATFAVVENSATFPLDGYPIPFILVTLFLFVSASLIGGVAGSLLAGDFEERFPRSVDDRSLFFSLSLTTIGIIWHSQPDVHEWAVTLFIVAVASLVGLYGLVRGGSPSMLGMGILALATLYVLALSIWMTSVSVGLLPDRWNGCLNPPCDDPTIDRYVEVSASCFIPTIIIALGVLIANDARPKDSSEPNTSLS